VTGKGAAFGRLLFPVAWPVIVHEADRAEKAAWLTVMSVTARQRK